MLSPDAPSFTKTPKDVSDSPGKSVSLECEAEGNPSPTYAWFKSGDENKVLGRTSKLELTLSDSSVGSYTCRNRLSYCNV